MTEIELDEKALEAALAAYRRNDAYPHESIEVCIRAYLRATTSPAPGVVEIKQIRWDKHTDYDEWYSYDDGVWGIGDYMVSLNPVGSDWHLHVRGHLLEEEYRSSADAMDAAQEDYEQRIRAALAQGEPTRQADGMEPPGCPAPGACSCPSAIGAGGKAVADEPVGYVTAAAISEVAAGRSNYLFPKGVLNAKYEIPVYAHSAPPAMPLDEVERVLEEVRDNGLIYWEPNPARGQDRKTAVVERLNDLLSRLRAAPSPKAEGERHG